MKHLTPKGEFKSDKYEWCPTGFFALKLTDPIAQLCALTYAELTDQDDLALSLREAIMKINEEEFVCRDQQ
jgi:hypothetical protein